jgi:GDP-L-fucose synthase
LVAKVVGFKGTLRFDASKPDGAPRKLLDVARIASFGWRPRVEIAQGISLAHRFFVQTDAAFSEKTA